LSFESARLHLMSWDGHGGEFQRVVGKQFKRFVLWRIWNTI